jgi:thymidylate kinase
MLIIEGPDNAGKSTLIEKLKEEFHLKSFHAGGPPKNQSDIDKRKIDAHQNCLEKIIQDRNYFISDIVYGGVLRKEPVYDNLVSLLKMLTTKPMVIYCRPPLDHLLGMKNHKVKDHETEEHVASVKENQLLLVHHYDELMKIVALHTPFIQYDFTQGFLKEDLITLTDFVNTRGLRL